MNYILFDDQKVREDMKPLTFTKPIADLRFGINTMREKWERVLGEKTSSLTEQYLSIKYPLIKADDNILINSSVSPTVELLKEIEGLKTNQALVGTEKVIAMNLSLENLESMETSETDEVSLLSDTLCINYPWDLFAKLDKAIEYDFNEITKGRKSQPISKTNNLLGDFPVFIEDGAIVEFAILNSTNGPIYIGKNAEIVEGAVIRGPFALGEGSRINANARVYGPTSIGPKCKVGGEVNNSVILGCSNKAHDGYLGNSVIGEWCNLGAGTNVSNLKNTYDMVRVWNYRLETFINTELQFCGLIMGDHSKTSINSMLNTGTVVGVSTNLFGAGFPRQFVSSFGWGGFNGFKKYNLKKAIEVAGKVYGRRDMEFDEVEKNIFKKIYDCTI